MAPEFLAAASDNDPTNLGTAASVGARIGLSLNWVAVLVAPLLSVVQVIAAHLGAVAGDDLQSLTLRRYGRGAAGALLVSTVVVNVVTIAADLQAGAAGLSLLVGVDTRWLVVPLAVLLGALLVVGRYQQVMRVLRVLLVGFLAFGVAALLSRPNWAQVLQGSLLPRLSLDGGALPGALALLGTTLTAYVYVWETVARGVEEPIGPDPGDLRAVKRGAVLGAVFTALILWFMLVASAATLGVHHHRVSSAADAARMLQPLAGSGAEDFFAAGLFVSAVVALPVLLSTTAYMLGAQFGWRRGLSEDVASAPAFYAALLVSLGLALGVTLGGVPVIPMLFVASALGGLGTPIGLGLLVGLARDREVMGDHGISSRLALAGWVVTVLVGALGATFVVAGLGGWL